MPDPGEEPLWPIGNIRIAKAKEYMGKEIDLVNHPPHYKHGPIEVIDLIEGFKLNYHLGNVIKYVLRADHKGSRVQDLQKAAWYLQREIEKTEGRKENPDDDPRKSPDKDSWGK